MFYNFAKAFCVILFKLFFKHKIIGSENIPSSGGFILAGNHVSYLDPVVFGIACPRPLYYMAKIELFRNPLFGWLLYKVNARPLKRHAADVGAIKEALRQLKGGHGVIIFPEGTRATVAEVDNRGLAGVGFLARKAKIPIVPAFVKGTDKALPKGAKFLKRGYIEVSFGQPIILCDCQKNLSDEEVTAKVMKAIALLDPAR